MLFSKVKILFFGKGVNDFIYFFFAKKRYYIVSVRMI
ncbi:hypothetical protein VPHK354_0004 [Vibrio phage K354]